MCDDAPVTLQARHERLAGILDCRWHPVYQAGKGEVGVSEHLLISGWYNHATYTSTLCL